jgi:hypothetical protein
MVMETGSGTSVFAFFDNFSLSVCDHLPLVVFSTDIGLDRSVAILGCQITVLGCFVVGLSCPFARGFFSALSCLFTD